MNMHTFTTRRSFLGSAAAAAACLALPRRTLAAAAKPNSVFNGVRIGCITYSYRGMANTAEETLKALLDDGISEVGADGRCRSNSMPASTAAASQGQGQECARGAVFRAAAADRCATRSATRQMPGAAQDVQRRGRQHPHPQNGLWAIG